ncbi:MAG: ABC transporter permease subunit, partial [Oscillospiraceae bacterium]|nr:ABC transporter permease subunit [Oscillospiraceae bacterium]
MIQQILTPWRWQNIFAEWPLLLRAFLVTLEAAVLALILALILGVIFGLLSTSRSRLLRIIARVYVEFFQNTPLMIQLFFAYFALPYMGVVLPAFACGVLCVGIYTGAYISEVVRDMIETIPKGQSAAANSHCFA